MSLSLSCCCWPVVQSAGVSICWISLWPDAKILSKDADSYPYMYRNYPFLRPWVDSLRQADALKDTFIINPHGIQLHAYYVAALNRPTRRQWSFTDIRITPFVCLWSGICTTVIWAITFCSRPSTSGRERRACHSNGVERPFWRTPMDEHCQQDFWRQHSNGGARYFNGRCDHHDGVRWWAAAFVKCFVEDCGYTSVWDEFSHELKSSFFLPPFPLMYTTSWLCEKNTGGTSKRLPHWSRWRNASYRCCLSTETKTRMCPPGWCTRFMKQNRSLKNFGLYRGCSCRFIPGE